MKNKNTYKLVFQRESDQSVKYSFCVKMEEMEEESQLDMVLNLAPVIESVRSLPNKSIAEMFDLSLNMIETEVERFFIIFTLAELEKTMEKRPGSIIEEIEGFDVYKHIARETLKDDNQRKITRLDVFNFARGLDIVASMNKTIKPQTKTTWAVAGGFAAYLTKRTTFFNDVDVFIAIDTFHNPMEISELTKRQEMAVEGANWYTNLFGHLYYNSSNSSIYRVFNNGSTFQLVLAHGHFNETHFDTIHPVEMDFLNVCDLQICQTAITSDDKKLIVHSCARAPDDIRAQNKTFARVSAIYLCCTTSL